MDRAKFNDFLYSESRKRFREILKESAESLGLDGQFFERASGPYLGNMRTFNDVLAEYPDGQTRSRAGSLLRASKAVQSEIDRHFKYRHKENTDALIDEMPSDKHMRLKLQTEYLLQRFGGIDAEAVDELSKSIREVKQLKVDWGQIHKQIDQTVEAAFSSRSADIDQLRRKINLLLDELKTASDQVEERKTNAASSDGRQSFKDSTESDRQHSERNLKEVDELISKTVSGIEDFRSSLTAHRNDVDELNHRQADFNERLDKLERQVEGIVDRLTDKAVEQIIKSLEELKNSFQNQLDGAKRESDGHRELVREEVAALSNRLDMFWSGNGTTLEEFLNLKSELLAYVVVKEINRVEGFLEAALQKSSRPEGPKKASGLDLIEGGLDLDSFVEDLEKELRISREFIELLKLIIKRGKKKGL